jgi:DNA polymerase (family 10)
VTNLDIADKLDLVAELLEFKGENPFRVRAYRNAARAVSDYGRPIEQVIRDPEADLTEISGIGRDLADKITRLVRTGRLAILEQLQTEIPETVLAILRVPGLGPKRASTLFHELHIRSLDDLRDACVGQRIRGLKGFGAKLEASILEGLEIASEADKRIIWAEADARAQLLLEYLREGPPLGRIEIAGSYRRKQETVGDLDLLVVADDVQAVMDHFQSYSGLGAVLARGDTKMSVRLASKLQVDLRAVPEESFGAALQYFTGSQKHNVMLRALAKNRDLKINEYGVFAGERRIAGQAEEEVYAAVNLPWIPPELREGRREFEWAATGKLPKLLELSDMQGDLHCHTLWSDGTATIEQMAEAAQARGLKYMAITDHSKRAAMVGGLNAARLRQQWGEIDRWNADHPEFQILKGVEMDILEQGGLDLDDDILSQADWVVASVHFGHTQPRAQITKRVVDALASPYVCAIAHPTGRLLTRRKPYEIDIDAVLRAAARHGKCMELNAHPARVDLDDVACAAAKSYGIPIVISTDSHSMDALSSMRYGVQQARRAGLTAADVGNAWPWEQLQARLARR